MVFGSGVKFSFGKISQEVFVAIETTEPPEVDGEHVICVPESEYNVVKSSNNFLIESCKKHCEEKAMLAEKVGFVAAKKIAKEVWGE